MNQTETIITIAWAVVFITAIQAFSTYCLVRTLVTGRPIFERKHDQEHDRVQRVVGIDR